MTMCLYINPHPVPGLISDCVVSRNGASEASPAEVMLANDPYSLGKIVRLTSKFAHDVGDTVLAFAANDAAAIFSFYEDFKSYFKLTFDPERPAKRIGEMVTDFNAGNENTISLLGFAPRQDDMNIVRPEYGASSALTERMNECFAIGSGAQAAITQIEKWVNGATSPKNVFKTLDSYELTLNILGSMNSSKLFGIWDYDDPSWGGYLQWRGFIRTQGVWAWTPDWIHLLYVVTSDGASFNAGLADRFAAYRNFGLTSQLIICRLLSGDPHCWTWPIDNLFHQRRAPRPSADPLEGFKPMRCTITVMYKKDGRVTYSHATLPPAAMSSLTFESVSTSLRLGIDRRILEYSIAPFLQEEDQTSLLSSA